MKKYLPMLLMAMGTFACTEESHIQIQSKLPAVKIENISFDNIQLGKSLLPGETAIRTIREKESSFPKRSQVSFYMISGTNKVYLRTKQVYRLDYEQTVKITLSDTTSVFNP